VTWIRSPAARCAGVLMARLALIAGTAAASFSGCACERPKRARRMGPDMPRIRVKLGKDAPSVAVAVKGPWRLMGGRGEIASGKTLDWTQVTAAGGNVVFRGIATVNGPVELRGADDGPLQVMQTVGGRARRRTYRGTLRISLTGQGAVRLVNVLPMEAYVAGVLPNELFRSWHIEAYKAQAIAARTYALVDRNARRRYEYDVLDSQGSQVYGGADTETATAWKAVEATWGVVATCRTAEGKRALFKTYYHSACGGNTVPAGAVFGGATPPPLAGGTKCTYCRGSKHYRWGPVTFSKDQVTDAVRRINSSARRAFGPVRTIRVQTRIGRGGRAARLIALDEAGRSATVSASALRLQLGASRIKSTWFDIEQRGPNIIFTNGRGYGHGVGLCQWGAQYLATHGKTGEEILRYYYPTVELVRVY